MTLSDHGSAMKFPASSQWSWSFWTKLGAVALFSAMALHAAPLPADLFAALSSQEFQEREAAEAKLLAWCKLKPEPAKAELFRQHQSAEDPEARARCLTILRTLVFEDYAREGEGYIGISMRDDTSQVPGDAKLRSVIRVMATLPDTAASNAGIQPNDLIVALADQVWYDVKASDLFTKQIRSMKPDQKVKLKILRADVPSYLEADPDVIKLSLKIGFQDEIVAYLESIIKHISNRNFLLKTIVDWEKFRTGA